MSDKMNEAQVALLNTPPDYMARLLATRNPGPEARGSRFAEPQTGASLYAAAWEPYQHADVQAPARAFRAPIPGYVGIAPLVALDPDATVRLTDPKGTGFVECEVQVAGTLPATPHTTLLVGPSSMDPDVLTVWTVFPGDPIMPSRLPAEMNEGRVLTVREAAKIGFLYAKVEVR